MGLHGLWCSLVSLFNTHLLHVQIMLLTALRSSQPGAAQMLEQIAMLVGLPIMAVKWLVRPTATLLAHHSHLQKLLEATLLQH